MFTGLIEQIGTVVSNTQHKVGNRLVIEADFKELQTGESISVNGVCLTLVPDNLTTNQLAFDVSTESLALTNLGTLKPNDGVNLERAMLASARFGGHLVNGHVDGKAKLLKLTPMDKYLEILIGEFTLDPSCYVIPKGSITLDGISLTVNEIKQGCVKLLLVPHTLSQTTLANKALGDWFNIEFDYLCRITATQLRVMFSNPESFRNE